MEEKLTVIGFLLKQTNITFRHKIRLICFRTKAEISEMPFE